MDMDLNIILWTVGMFFSLGVFALKVGFGLSLGGSKYKQVLIALSIYMALFVMIAYFSQRLIGFLLPVLSSGQYIHLLMAAGLFIWGILLIRKQGDRVTHKIEFKNSKLKTFHKSLSPSLLLMLPCPVCLSAMTFSVWSALSFIKLPPLLIGLGLGSFFSAMSLLFVFLTRLLSRYSSLRQESFLGLSMAGIGLYFLASLFIPARVEEAKGVYQSFVRDNAGSLTTADAVGIYIMLFIAMLIGFLLGARKEVKR